MRLLVVEDEETLARYVRRGLEEAAWTVDVSATVDDAWRLLLLNPYDLVVLDLGLPGSDGGELLRRVREAGMDTPVLILTARGSVEDRVAGLNAGADDYLSKPFAFAELLARIRALSRRGRAARAAVLSVGDLQLDVLKRQARRGPRSIELTAREFNVLECLMQRAGEVVTRTMLAEHVWGDHYDSLSNLIEVFVNRLRKKLETGGTPRLLHTVRGAGYVMRESPLPEDAR
jgi:DNA-binding response OmpR family regulator